LDVTNTTILRAWQKGELLRTKNAIFEKIEVPKGRLGIKRNVRGYHKYTVPVTYEKGESFTKDGLEYVSYSEANLDHRRPGEKSKSQRIIDFLRDNSDKAWFSTQIRKQLGEDLIKACDIMTAVRSRAKKGWVYVRGYTTDSYSTPFREGFLLTWIDQDLLQDQAIKEAFERTEITLSKSANSSPIAARIHRIRGLLIEAARANEIRSPDYLRRELRCTNEEFEGAMKRTLQLYVDVRQVRLFDAYRYFHHDSFDPQVLSAVIKMKENYLRMTKGKDSRIGHNFEAAVDWFVDKFTPNARFRTQMHRTPKMDPRRITLHLTKPVGDRKNNAEVDRAWEVDAGPFTPAATYVLESKWGLVQKRYIDDFFQVLKWSSEFGADSSDSSDGRTIKQGVVGLFAGDTFNPNENVKLRDGSTVSLPTYAARNNIRILKAAEFNFQLRSRGVEKKVTVQKICRVASDENEVRDLLDSIWKSPSSAMERLEEAAKKNSKVYELEGVLIERDDEIEDAEKTSTPTVELSSRPLTS